MTAIGSGTSLVPASSPGYMWHWMKSDWMLMAHGNLIAGFNHQNESDNFKRFSGTVDRPNKSQGSYPGMQRQPQFFSENLASLSSTLAGVSAENIIVHAEGSRVTQTVTYEWSQ